MLVDSFEKDWLERLDSITEENQRFGKTFLLLDGAFIPGIHRRFSLALQASEKLNFLFEDLPGWREAVRDVSPFVIEYGRANVRLKQALNECSGWPMVSALCTPEPEVSFIQRLARWCVVEAAGQNINLRFPDTRRLPDIYSVLTDEQRADMLGPAGHCSYMGRDGRWLHIALSSQDQESNMQPKLTAAQFEALVACSEGDSVLAQLESRNAHVGERPLSAQYQKVCNAIALAKMRKLERRDMLNWCEFSLEQTVSDDGLAGLFDAWHSERISNQIV